MERINEILSVQALSRVHYPLQFELQMRMMQELERQRQHQQQEQLQQHQQQQQQLLHHQQHKLPLPPQPLPAITQRPNNTNGSGSTSNGHPTIKQSSSRNSHTTSKNRHNSNKKDSSAANINNSVETNLIDLITCTLCKGYLIDATTLELCMHTFCRPCALRYIRDEHRCPECNMEIKDKRFLNRLKPDVMLQSIVYKLVPGLYEKEMARRRKFYAARPTVTPRYKCEMFGDIPPAKTIKPDDMLNISLTWLRDSRGLEPVKTYLLLRADSTILILKKLVINKFGLERPIKFYYEKSEILFDLTALMDVAVTFEWSPEKKVLELNFTEQEILPEVEPT